MLSPGEWFLRVPRESKKNHLWRLRMLRAAAQDRQIQEALLHGCKNDLFFYISAFVFQTNPDKFGKEDGPMIPYPFQIEAMRLVMDELLVKRGDVLIEKSRKMGWSWLSLIMLDWLCLFHHRKNVFVISHSEQAVDTPDDPSSLFWKLRFIHKYLPSWMTRGLKKRKLGFHYPATDSNLNGGATTERSGVGGRATVVMMDEFSKHKRDAEIWGQTHHTGVRLVIGTHYGIAGKFFELTQERTRFKIVSHWSQHPVFAEGLYRYNRETNKVEVLDKQYEYPLNFQFVMNGEPDGGPFPCLRSPWYDHEDRRANSRRDMAMHLDIHPQGSVSQFFHPVTTILRLIADKCRLPVWEGDIRHDENGGDVKLIERRGGPLRLWIKPDAYGRLARSRYFAAADVSTGRGITPSCISGIDGLRGQKVAEFTSAKIDELSLSPVAIAFCNLLLDEEGNGAKFVWETPGPGVKFGEKVRELGYGNIYRQMREDMFTRKMTERVGWVKTDKTGLKLLEEYKDALFTETLTNPSKEAMEETLDFFYNDQGYPEHGKLNVGEPGGAKVNHGDRVIADAMAWMLAKPYYKTPERREEPESARQDSMAGRFAEWEHRRSHEALWS